MQAAARVMAWPCPHPAHRRHGDLPAHPVRHRARHVGVLRTEQPVLHLADPRCHHRAPHLGSALPSASCCRKSGSDIKTRYLHANDVTFDIGRILTLPDGPRRPLAHHRRAHRLAAPEKSAVFDVVAPNMVGNVRTRHVVQTSRSADKAAIINHAAQFFSCGAEVCRPSTP